MQTDQSIDSATATSRRTFLTRTAGLGALVTAGALVVPGSPLALSAGARPADQGTLKDPDFAAFATNLELAAVAAYTSAFDRDLLDDEWADIALEFQSHHQAIADTLTELRDPDAPEPVAEAALSKRAVELTDAATDQDALLLALSEVEEICAATHLAGIAQLAEKSTARTVIQVAAVEGQQAALLAVGAGTAVAEVTPATNTGDAALTIPSGSTSSSTTTTSATAGSDTGDSQDPDASPETDNTTESNSDTQTSAPSAND